MRRSYIKLLLFIILMVLSVPDAFACFGDKLGIAHLKGTKDEFSAQLVAIYIKEKTGTDSVINVFKDNAAAQKSLEKDETDIIIITGRPDELDNEKLAVEKSDSKFFTLIEGDDLKIVLRVSKTRLADLKFFTLNKVMERIGKVISPDELKKQVADVKSGAKFPKQAAREYLLEKDLI